MTIQLIFDIETNGLYHDTTEIHCLCIADATTSELITYNDEGNAEPIVRGITRLEEADCIIGHNIIGFDIPVIQKIYPWFSPPKVTDTLVLSHLYHADMLDLDKKRNWKDMPPKLYGSHSLESYGYRLNYRKGSYGSHTDWKQWTPEMEDYCKNDVQLSKHLCKHFVPLLSS